MTPTMLDPLFVGDLCYSYYQWQTIPADVKEYAREFHGQVTGRFKTVPVWDDYGMRTFRHPEEG